MANALKEAVQATMDGKQQPSARARRSPNERQQQSRDLSATIRDNKQNFREQKLKELSGEREAPAPDPVDTTIDEDALQDDEQLARQTSEKSTAEPSSQDDDTDGLTDDDDDDEEAVAPASEEATEGDDAESESEDDSPAAQLQARVEELETKSAELERGFRQKTHRLSESQRNLGDQMETVETTAAFYANLAEQGVRAYDNVDWNALQANPIEYQKATREFQQATQNHQRLVGALQQLKQENSKRRELLKQQEASVARDMLVHEIPNWNRERFSELRDYAVDKTGLYTDEEFQDLTDWRVLKLLHVAEGLNSAPRKIDGLRVKGGKRKPKAAKNAPKIDMNRDARGRFAQAKEALRADPTNRATRRQYFMAKLEAEKRGG